MAIEALETAEVQSEYDGLSDMIFKAIIACKEALGQPTKEPVTWMNDIAFSMDKDELTAEKFGDIIPLYTHPKEWQGITKNKIIAIDNASNDLHEFARAIKAKLKEKNTER